MANPFFQFKQVTIYQDRCAMKVTTDACFFGAWAANEIQNEKLRIRNVLDIGAGTGLLSLMIAQKTKTEIDAVEIDKDAAQQAKENIQASFWKNQIHVLNEDIISFKTNKQYDCIISNPPFYENELSSEIKKKNIAHHSEQLRISQVLKIIRTYLKEEGIFFLMYPYKRKKEIEKLFSENQLYLTDSIILKQSVNHSAFRMIVKGCTQKMKANKEISVSVWNELQQYTTEFVHLLKDYYLNL